MLTLILTFLKTHWQTSLIAAAILAVVTTLSVQHLVIHHLRSELSACHAESVVLEDSNQKLIASVNGQDAAIAALRADGLARRNAASRALAAAKLRSGKHDENARRIIAEASGPDDCVALRKIIGDYAAGKH